MELSKKDRHLLNRITGGLTETLISEFLATGREAYINQQLNPESVYLENEVKEVPDIFYEFIPNYRQNVDGIPLSDTQKKQMKKDARNYQKAVTIDKIKEAVKSPYQFQEVMAFFWFNHFNVWSSKDDYTQVLMGHYNNVIKYQAFGKFRALLEAVALHPAMLTYLDNVDNQKQVIDDRGIVRESINENYARELMELHTLGAYGGYTDDDIIALAKILSGWTVIEGIESLNPRGSYFQSSKHDFSTKEFLGHTIEGTGEDEIYQVLDILASHPSTAKFVVTKLLIYLVSDELEEDYINEISDYFLQTGGDIRAVLAKIIETSIEPEEFSKQFCLDELEGLKNKITDSTEYTQTTYIDDLEQLIDNSYFPEPVTGGFYHESNIGTKYRTPFEFLVSFLRVLQDQTDVLSTFNRSRYFDYLKSTDMPYYEHITPDGYPLDKDFWYNSNNLSNRLEGARLFARDCESLIDNGIDLAGISELLFEDTFNLETDDMRLRDRLAKLLGNPKNQYK